MTKKQDRYPHAPGSRRGSPETSPEAGESVADPAKSREMLALAFIGARGALGATADEVAIEHEWEIYSSRPRLSGLVGRKAIVDSTERRMGLSGRRQAVWVLPEFAPPKPDSPPDSQWDFLNHG